MESMAVSSGVLDLINKYKDGAKGPSAESSSALINMSRYQMASGINNAQMPAAMHSATADYKQSLRGSANTQTMMGITNPFLGLQGGAASSVQGDGVASSMQALTSATNTARASRMERLSGLGNVMDGNAQTTSAGLTDLSTIASNSSIRKIARDLEASNARKGLFASVIGGAFDAYDSYSSKANVFTGNTPRASNQNMNYGTNSWVNDSYQTRPFK